MGQTLSEPVVEKLSESDDDERLAYGLSSMQGWRVTMEDSHAAALDLRKPDTPGPTLKDKRLSFFGVYDGHGGEKVAAFSGENVHKILVQQTSLEEGDYKKALQDAFLATDRAILQDPRYGDEPSGCTATTALISETTIYVANAGDSRTVLGVRGRAKPLSLDHKPQNEAEKTRIVAAGGFVDFGRVNGNLALSRAIGDFEFKRSADLPPEQQIVTSFPDVNVHEILDDDEFLVLACDGIWDCRSSQAVIEFVRRGVAAHQELHRICENIMDNCLAHSSDTGGVGCDNMTIIIVALLQGKTKEEWYDMIAKRVADGDGPCAPPEYAQFRGPGVHNNFDDSPDEFDQCNHSDSRRVIRLCGPDPLVDSDSDDDDDDDDDEDMLDGNEEEKEKDDEALKKVTIKDKSEDEDMKEIALKSDKDKENAKIDSVKPAPPKDEKPKEVPTK